MKSFIAILIFTFVGSIFASTAIFKSLAEIDKDPFGSTILSAISLNLKAKAPIDDVRELLQGILDDLLADHETLKTTFENQQERLEAAISNGESLIGSYDEAIRGLRGSIDSDTSTRATKETTLGNTQAALAFEQRRLEALETAYQTTIPAADADISDLQRGITAVNNAQTRMGSYQASAAATTGAVFVELTSNAQKDMKKVTDTISSMKKVLTKHSNLYTPLVRELVALSANVDQTKADQIISLLGELAEILRTALSDVQSARATFLANYERDKEDANANVLTYTGQIAQLEQDIDNLDARIRQANLDLETAIGFRDAAQAQLDADRVSLDQATTFFNDQNPRYERIIALVRRIIDHFNTNVAAVDEYTRGRIENEAVAV